MLAFTALFILAPVVIPTPALESSFDRALVQITNVGFAVVRVFQPGPSDFPFVADGFFVHQQRRIDLSLHASQFSGVGLRQRHVEAIQSGGAAGSAIQGSPSGVSLGEHCYRTDQGLGTRVRVVVDRYRAGIHMPFSRVGSAELVTERRRFARAFCERIARVLLADAMALDLDDEGRAQATATLTGCETNKQGFTTLARWALERSVTVSYDENTASASFSRNGKSVKLYLASDRAVVNGQEFPLGGKFVMARGSRWFVPAQELDAATR